MGKAVKLTIKQSLFVKEYIIDFNASQAAIRAGYSKKTAGAIGHENLNKPDIQAAITGAITARAKRTEITADYVLSSLQNVAERCQQAEPVMVRGEGGVMTESGEYRFDSSGANKSLELLGKHLRLFAEKLEFGNSDGTAFQIKVVDE